MLYVDGLFTVAPYVAVPVRRLKCAVVAATLADGDDVVCCPRLRVWRYEFWIYPAAA